MTREELQTTLAFLETGEIPNVEIFILDEPVNTADGTVEVNIYRGRMHKDMPEQITDLFFPKMKRILVKREYTMEDYNPSLTPDRKVLWQYGTGEVPLYNLIIGKLAEVENNYYNDDILAYEDIWAIWIKLHVETSDFYLLKKITKGKVMTTGGVLACVFRSNVFKRIEGDVLTIDGHFDVFSCNGTLFFENKTNFEQVLNYDEVVQEIAEATLEEIRTIDIVEDFDGLKSMLANDYNSIRKLNRLSQKQYFKEKTFADYHKIIQDYHVPVNVDVANGKFKIADKAQAKLLIKVLNDDFLKSELTNLKYAANSKDDWG